MAEETCNRVAQCLHSAEGLLGWDGVEMRRGTESGAMRVSASSLQLLKPAFNLAFNKHGLSIATNEDFLKKRNLS